MKINAVITAKRIKNPLESEHIYSFASAVTIAVGLFAGCLIFFLCRDNIINELSEIFLSFNGDFCNKNKPEIFSGLVFSSAPYIILSVILGTCAVGAPFVILLTALKSAAIGLVTSYIYYAFSLQGVEYCLLVFFPGKIILVFAMLLLTGSCISTARGVLKSVVGEDTIKSTNLQNYFLRSALIALIFILSSTVDFLMIICFSSLFSF